MKKKSDFLWGMLALAVVGTFGMAFISMNVVSEYFTPAQVMLIRTVIAYIALLIAYPKFHKVESLRQELIYAAAGICGTTMYVMCINSAYAYTQVANVSVLASLSPIFVALFTPLFFKGTKIPKIVFIGFAIATFGTAIISTNGTFRLSLAFKGDSLALLAAAFWGCYSLLLRKNTTKYPQLYATRRMFLYGILAVIPIILFQQAPMNFTALKDPKIIVNFLFLGIGVYLGCHVCAGLVIKAKGAVWQSKFTYCEPIITMVLSALILSEQITLPKIIGAVFILAGVMVSDGIFSKKRVLVKEIEPIETVKEK